MGRPVFLVCTANAPVTAGGQGELRHLAAETRGIREALSEPLTLGLCQPEFISDASLDDIVHAFETHRGEVRVFHYGGHANSYELLLQTDDGRQYRSGASSFADYLGLQEGLELVFLNGCSTAEHIDALHRAGVPSVVATSEVIVDSTAAFFAERFYSAIGADQTIEKAFEEATALSRNKCGDDQAAAVRDVAAVAAPETVQDETGWPWLMSPPAGERTRWSLSVAFTPSLEPMSAPEIVPGSILFDQAHGQDLWRYAPPPVVKKGYRQFAQAMGSDHPPRYLIENGVFRHSMLTRFAGLVLPIGPEGRTKLEQTEIDAIRTYLGDGGAVVLLSCYTGDWHHAANLNEVSSEFGIEFNCDVVVPAGSSDTDARVQFLAGSPESAHVVTASPPQLRPPFDSLTQGVTRVATLSSCSLSVGDGAVSILESAADSMVFRPEPAGGGIAIAKYSHSQAQSGPVPLAAVSKSVRLLALGTWKLLLDEFVQEPDFHNGLLLANIGSWLSTEA